jgi:hypothetical protein
MQVQVSGANRTSKAAAALASKTRSAPGSCTASPSAALEGVARNPFAAAAPAKSTAEGEPGEATQPPAAAGGQENPSAAQQRGGDSAQAAWPSRIPKADGQQAEQEQADAEKALPPVPGSLRPREPSTQAAAASDTAAAPAAARRPASRQQAAASPPAPKEAALQAPQPSARLTRAKSKSPEPAAMQVPTAAPPSQPAAHKTARPTAGPAAAEPTGEQRKGWIGLLNLYHLRASQPGFHLMICRTRAQRANAIASLPVP